MRVVRTLIVLWLGLTATVLYTGSPASAANAHQLINGSGSSWAANAVNQWISDVHRNNLQVVFSSQGSAQGRIDFANKTADFAVSDIGFLGKDPVTGANDDSGGRGYSYLPIVAGGTSLIYHLVVNGQMQRNVRLSGETIAKIFTQKITNWDDPAIQRDNHLAKPFPSIPIIPVQHSEGSGSTYQFTRYMAKEFPGIWKAGATEYFPNPTGSAVAQNGSDSVLNYLTSSSANGAIGYDEYSYALNKGYPVIKVLNSAGYYTLPTQYNVAVALTKAVIDPKTLLQTLDAVYSYSDKRVYPISSYSYAIIPIGAKDPTMNTAKRQTLADYLKYSVCGGQAEMGQLGYSPLPLNLVQDSFDQVKKLHTADPKVDVSTQSPSACNNPTFVAGHPDQNYLAKVAPQPQACDKQGAGPCTGVANSGQANPRGGVVPVTSGGSGGGSTGAGAAGGSTGGSGGGGGTTGSGGATAGGAAGTGGTGTGTGATTGAGTTGSGGTVALGGSVAATQIDPNTGQRISSSGGGDASGQQAVGDTTLLPDSQSGSTDTTLGLLAGGLLLAALIAPALIASRSSRTPGTGPGKQ